MCQTPRTSLTGGVVSLVEEAGQLLPKRQRVVAHLARLAAGQHGFARGQDVFADLIEQRQRFLLAQEVARGVIHLLLARLGLLLVSFSGR